MKFLSIFFLSFYLSALPQETTSNYIFQHFCDVKPTISDAIPTFLTSNYVRLRHFTTINARNDILRCRNLTLSLVSFFLSFFIYFFLAVFLSLFLNHLHLYASPTSRLLVNFKVLIVSTILFRKLKKRKMAA